MLGTDEKCPGVHGWIRGEIHASTYRNDPQEQAEGAEEMLTLREAGELLGLKRARLMQLIAQGELRSEKRLADVGGSQRYISRAELQRFIQARETQAAQGRKPGRPPKVPRLPS